MRPIADLAADLASGRTTSVELTEAALARIADPAGEGAATFMVVHADAARAAAQASDRPLLAYLDRRFAEEEYTLPGLLRAIALSQSFLHVDDSAPAAPAASAN